MGDRRVWGLVCAVMAFVFGTAAWIVTTGPDADYEAAGWLALLGGLNLVIAISAWRKS